MTIEEEIEQKSKLFDKFRKMSPEELDAYEKRLEAEKDAAEDEIVQRIGGRGYKYLLENSKINWRILAIG